MCSSDLQGHRLNLVPIITHLCQSLFGPRLAPLVFVDEAKEVSLDPQIENEFMVDGVQLFVHPMDKDPEHIAEHQKALQQIVKDYPDDLEAKAMLAVRLWQDSADGVPYGDKETVDALIRPVLAANPLHPANHYRIHLWDEGQKATNALVSAANDGFSAPGIAHMWHMSGHTYSEIGRAHV